MCQIWLTTDQFLCYNVLDFFKKGKYCILNEHLQTNSILATEQYGFRKVLSTEHATFSLTDNILMAQKKKSYWWNLL